MHGSQVIFLAALLIVDCNTSHPAPDTNAVAPAKNASEVVTNAVDSIFPMPVMVARFQTEMRHHPADLAQGSPLSRDELIARFENAVARNDTLSLRSLRLDVEEFAQLYVATSFYSQEPYKQPPSIQWVLTDQASRKGEAGLLKRYGGRTGFMQGYECPNPPVKEGENTVWKDCQAIVAQAPFARTTRLFGSIMARNGRFKFVSLANEL
jgi:hypothetical protein